MRIEIEFTGPLRTLVGVATEQREVETGASVASVIDVIAREYEGAVRAALESSATLITVDDVHVGDPTHTTLSDGSRVTFLLPISGG